MTVSMLGRSLKAKRIPLLAGAALGSSLTAGALAQQPISELAPVVVTASGFEQDIRSAPASISVVTRQELEAKSFFDLADALRDIEGVDVRGATGKTGNLNISIRGMPSEYTLVLIDGRRQNSAGDITPNGFGDTSTGFIPPLAAIERIEVIRGPMSTLYGSDAMGGVVNIITRKVAREWGGSTTLETQIEQNSDAGNTNKANFYLSGPIVADKLGVSLRGSVLRRGESTLEFGDGSTVSTRGPSPVGGRSYTLGTKFSFTPNRDHDIWLDLDRARQRFDNDACQLGNLDGTQRNDCAIPNPRLFHGYRDVLRFNRDQVAVGHSSRLSFGTLESSLMRNQTETLGRSIPNEARPAGDPSIGQDRELKTTNTIFDTKLVAPIGESHIVMVGGQYWRASMIDGLVTDEYEQDTLALFAEDEWSLTDTLTATLGARYDHHDAFGSQWSPRGYLVWNPTDYWTVKGGVSRGYRTPGLNQLHGGVNSITGQGTTIGVGNPNLKPEVSTSSELGVHYDSLQGWAVGATGFHNRIKDKISSTTCGVSSISTCFVQGATANSSYPVNLDNATTRGVEMTSRFDLAENWTLRLNYTFTDSELKRNGRADGPLSDTARHMANATLRWDMNERYSLWLQGEYRGKSRRFDGDPSSYTGDTRTAYEALGDLHGYTIVNLGGQYRFSRNVTLNAAVYNLFDKDFLECQTWTNSAGDVLCGSPYIESGRSTKGVIPYAGRAFWLSANISF